jgi:SAM-dependent methyltransferase
VSHPSPRFWPLFLEVYEALPRQGPGSLACVERALALCGALPAAPVVLDLGCGSGAQTLQLAGLLDGHLVALDSHPPLVGRLRATLAERALAGRVGTVVGDMARPPFPPGCFDLVWSEGALYQVGLENALRVCHDLLRPGGRLAFTEPVWRRPDPPPEVRALFDLDYPDIGEAGDALAALDRVGFELLGRFTLPDEAWWDDFYSPMTARLETVRGRYAGDPEALAVLDELALEPELHRRHGSYYAYEFFVARKPAGSGGGAGF